MSDKVLQINKPSEKLLDFLKVLNKAKEENQKKLLAKKDSYFPKK
jgi:hypothetical protein